MNISYPSRSFNSVYQLSTNADTIVHYSIEILCTLTLAGGQTGTVYLEVADDSEFTTNVQEISRCSNRNTGALAIGLSIVQANTMQLSGVIETYKYMRIRPESNTGSPSFTYVSGQEAINN